MKWEAIADDVQAKDLSDLKPIPVGVRVKRATPDCYRDLEAAKEAASISLDRLGGRGTVRLSGTAGETIRVVVSR